MKNPLKDTINTSISIVSIPYYSNLSENVKRFFQKKYDVKIAFRINSKLDKFIILGKDLYEIGEKINATVVNVTLNGHCELE